MQTIGTPLKITYKGHCTVLAGSVEKLATSLQSMVKEQEKQGKRLEILEGRDGEKWRKVIGYVGTTVLGILIAFVAMKLGLAG